MANDTIPLADIPGLADYYRRQSEGKQIWRRDSHDERFFGLMEWDRFPEVLTAIRLKRFTAERTDASSRVVNLWESEGVVDDPREEGQGWRRYSIMDLAWLGSIMELRRFGVPMETLRKAKDGIRALDPPNPLKGFRLFEFYVLEAMQRVPVYLLVFEDGEVDLTNEHEYATTPLLYPLADHVRISLNRVVQKVLPKLDLTPKHRPGVALTSKEKSVVLALRHPNNKRVTVQLKDGEPAMLETERDGTGKTVKELMEEAPHSELTVKRKNGQTVHLSQILKEKL